MLDLLPDPLPLVGQIITLLLLVVALVTFLLWLLRFWRDYKDEKKSALDTQSWGSLAHPPPNTPKKS